MSDILQPRLTREEFEEIARSEGFAAPKEVAFDPRSCSAAHTHDQISFVYVLDGTFILNTADGAPAYTAGQTCRLDAHVEHAEEVGEQGARILVARK